MYKKIISDAVNDGYRGLNYYRYNRDDFYYASNLIAMSDDYRKINSNYKKNVNEENYLGFKRNNLDNEIICNNSNSKNLHELLKLIERHPLFEDSKKEEYSTILNDIQTAYYVIGHIYKKVLEIISIKNPEYYVINNQTITNCTIDKNIIEKLSGEEKTQLLSSLQELFTSKKKLSNHFDKTIDKIKIKCKYDEKEMDISLISQFIENITSLKSEIENLIPIEILDNKNNIIKIKNTLNALRYMKKNNHDKYVNYIEYENKLRYQLKNIIRDTYVNLFKNKESLRFNEIMSYFSDILQDPQQLSSIDSESKSLCEEIYEEIIKELDKDGIPEIDDKDDFKIFTMRVSAPSFGLYKLLYTYEKEKPLCRLEVYGEMIKRIYGKEYKKIVKGTIDQIIQTEKYSTYDSVMCSDEYIKLYIDSINITSDNIKRIIYQFDSIDCLDKLIEYIPSEYIDLLEDTIIGEMNEGKINSGEINSKNLYKCLVKRTKGS